MMPILERATSLTTLQEQLLSQSHLLTLVGDPQLLQEFKIGLVTHP